MRGRSHETDAGSGSYESEPFTGDYVADREIGDTTFWDRVDPRRVREAHRQPRPLSPQARERVVALALQGIADIDADVAADRRSTTN